MQLQGILMLERLFTDVTRKLMLTTKTAWSFERTALLQRCFTHFTWQQTLSRMDVLMILQGIVPSESRIRNITWNSITFTPFWLHTILWFSNMPILLSDYNLCIFTNWNCLKNKINNSWEKYSMICSVECIYVQQCSIRWNVMVYEEVGCIQRNEM